MKRLYCGNPLSIMQEMSEKEEKVDLIYADLSLITRSRPQRPAQRDEIAHFHDTLYKDTVYAVRSVLKPTGCVYFLCLWDEADRVRFLADGVLGEVNRKNVISWRPLYSGERIILFYSRTRLSYNNDRWDIPSLDQLNDQARERNFDYGKYRELALMEYIVETGSNIGDAILDPFLDARPYNWEQGTTIEVAERLGRRWIGIANDQNVISSVVRHLQERCKLVTNEDYAVIN